MSDMYKAFIRRFQAATIGQGMSVKQIAEIMRVHPKTVYGWFRLNNCMDGESVVRALELVMGWKV
jgi:hypothetical protein